MQSVDETQNACLLFHHVVCSDVLDHSIYFPGLIISKYNENTLENTHLFEAIIISTYLVKRE